MDIKNWLGRNQRTLALSLGPPSAVGGLALATGLQYGGWAVAAEFLATVGAGSLASASFSRRWSPELSWASSAAAVASAQATVTSIDPFSALGFYAWAVSVGLSGAAAMVLRHRTRMDHHHERMAEARIDLERAKLGMAVHRLQQAENKVIAGELVPQLQGPTVEESAIRRAIWDLYKTELPGVYLERLPEEDGCSGWTVQLDLPTSLQREKLQREWARVAGALALPGVFESVPGALSNQLVVRYQEGDPLASVVPYEPSRARSFLDPVLLGRDGRGRPVEVELAYNHTMLSGSAKFGKSNLMKLLAIRLAALPDVVLYGIDMKPGAPEFNLIRPILHDLATTVEQARAMLQWLVQEMKERGDILAKSGDTAWDPARHGRPAIFLLIDELAELVRQGDRVKKPEIPVSAIIESALALSRAYGIQLILGTQQPSNRVFGKSTDSRGNISIRISVRTNDARHAMFMFSGNSRYRPGDLNYPGKALILSPDHNDGQPFKAVFISDQTCSRAVAELSISLVAAPVDHRLILPAPADLNNQEAIRHVLESYSECSRAELDRACGLTKEQTLRALRAMAPEAHQDRSTLLWSLRPDDWLSKIP